MSDAISGIIGGLTSIGSTSANAVLAAQTRKWMEHMRDTQYQATVKDLRKANLNPLLALGGGPSSAGVGTPPTAHVEDPGPAIAQAVSGAIQWKLAREQIRAVRAEADQKETGAETARLQQGEAAMTPRLQNDLLRLGFLKSQREMDLMGAQARESNARAVREGVNAALGRAELPAKEAEGRFYSTEFGQNYRAVERILQGFPALSGAMRAVAPRVGPKDRTVHHLHKRVK